MSRPNFPLKTVVSLTDLQRKWHPILAPLSGLYEVVISLRNSAFDRGLLRSHKAARPVVSVGNISCGGTGKTPFVAWLWEECRKARIRAVVLSRGYAGNKVGNDEADELRALGIPVYCNPNRAAEASRRSEEADLFILDDGFQHRQLHRDLDIVLVDATRPFASDRLLPSGLLREPPSSLSRAQVVVLTRSNLASDSEQQMAQLYALAPRSLVLQSFTVAEEVLEPVSRRREAPSVLSGAQVCAMSGIGNPQQFEAVIRSTGAQLLEHFAFPDHHPYTEADVRAVVDRANSLGAQMILTTGKDYPKCRGFDHAGKLYILSTRHHTPLSGSLLEKVFALTGIE